MDVLIYSDYLRNHSLDLYQLWNFDELFPNSFDLVDLRNSDRFLYNFFNDLLSSNYLFYFCFDGNKLLNNRRYFFNNLLEVWYDLLDLHDRFLDKDAFNYSLNLSDFDHFMDHRHNLLHYLRNRNDSFNYLFSSNNLLNNSINWNWNFKRYNYLLLHRHWERYFYILSYYLFNSYCSWDLLNYVNWNLSQYLFGDYLLFNFGHLNYSLDYCLHCFLYFDIDVFDDLDFFDALLDDWYMN